MLASLGPSALRLPLLFPAAGWVTNFLSHAQVSGFMTGAAILIGLSQVSRPLQTLGPWPQRALRASSRGARARLCCSARRGQAAAALCTRSACPHMPAGHALQVKYILGLTVPRSDRIQDYLQTIFDNLWQFK